jgi:hypothetical protein
MDVLYIDKRRYEIQEHKEVPVWYTDIYRPISSTAYRALTPNNCKSIKRY